MKREHRTARVEIRAPEDTPGMFEAVVMRYGVVDDYDTIFDPGCFTDSLTERLPRITWGHDWADVIGRYIDYKDTDDTLTLVGQLSDFDAVPRARQAYAQLQDGTIDQFSVGFRRVGSLEDDDGITHFTKATLDEAALVLAGAVPGTSLVGVRTLRWETKVGDLAVVREVPEALVIDLAKQVADGTLSKEAAQVALDLAAGTSAPDGDTGGGDDTPPEVETDPTLDAAADQALEALGLA